MPTTEFSSAHDTVDFTDARLFRQMRHAKYLRRKGEADATRDRRPRLPIISRP